MACGPFFPAEQADYYLRAFDWQTPLMLASLPLAVLLVSWLLRLWLCQTKKSEPFSRSKSDGQPASGQRGFIALPPASPKDSP
jgi:hypothetical protein